MTASLHMNGLQIAEEESLLLLFNQLVALDQKKKRGKVCFRGQKMLRMRSGIMYLNARRYSAV